MIMPTMTKIAIDFFLFKGCGLLVLVKLLDYYIIILYYSQIKSIKKTLFKQITGANQPCRHSLSIAYTARLASRRFLVISQPVL